MFIATCGFIIWAFICKKQLHKNDPIQEIALDSQDMPPSYGNIYSNINIDSSNKGSLKGENEEKLYESLPVYQENIYDEL